MKTIIENSLPEQYGGFVAYFHKVMEQRKVENQNYFNYNIALKHLEKFTRGEIEFAKITKNWLKRLSNYLKTTDGLRCEKKLSANSANTYFNVILTVVKAAVDQSLLDQSVINELAIMPRTRAEPNYFTLDELNKLASTPWKHTILKNAFLFSCLTGLGWKEIDLLKWDHVRTVNGNWHIAITNNDTDLYVPLNQQARLLAGNRGKAESKIFDLHYSAALCSNLNKWAIQAGVYRQISFSTAKQTFGMTLLKQGVPIELISELLGHKHVKSTIKLLDCPTK